MGTKLKMKTPKRPSSSLAFTGVNSQDPLVVKKGPVSNICCTYVYLDSWPVS